MEYVVILNGEPVFGPSTKIESLEKYIKRNGGELKRAVWICPTRNRRIQTYVGPFVDITKDPVEYSKRVIEIPTETVRKNLIDFVGKYAEQRILAFAPYWKQINAITDPDPDLTARIKAVRDASNVLEAEIKAMDRDGLAALAVEAWSGWPEVGLPV
ncbi:hypothetical protein [Maridesulfovibrio sp.]|uniref:hypothetical protein n=1 Tax=Maridesulfovibrio sp. TaxID=2795000 RepID=UPI0039F0D96A